MVSTMAARRSCQLVSLKRLTSEGMGGLGGKGSGFRVQGMEDQGGGNREEAVGMAVGSCGLSRDTYDYFGRRRWKSREGLLGAGGVGIRPSAKVGGVRGVGERN